MGSASPKDPVGSTERLGIVPKTRYPVSLCLPARENVPLPAPKGLLGFLSGRIFVFDVHFTMPSCFSGCSEQKPAAALQEAFRSSEESHP